MANLSSFLREIDTFLAKHTTLDLTITGYVRNIQLLPGTTVFDLCEGEYGVRCYVPHSLKVGMHIQNQMRIAVRGNLYVQEKDARVVMAVQTASPTRSMPNVKSITTTLNQNFDQHFHEKSFTLTGILEKVREKDNLCFFNLTYGTMSLGCVLSKEAQKVSLAEAQLLRVTGTIGFSAQSGHLQFNAQEAHIPQTSNLQRYTEPVNSLLRW